MDEQTTATLHEVTRRITAALHPEKIYLFGSHAWGTATPDSDIDLFIIVKESDQLPYRRSRDVYRCLRGIREPIEVLVRTSEEVKKSSSVVASLTAKILNHGMVLYG
jgi:predicted nucleotidyltransferase